MQYTKPMPATIFGSVPYVGAEEMLLCMFSHATLDSICHVVLSVKSKVAYCDADGVSGLVKQ